MKGITLKCERWRGHFRAPGHLEDSVFFPVLLLGTQEPGPHWGSEVPQTLACGGLGKERSEGRFQEGRVGKVQEVAPSTRISGNQVNSITLVSWLMLRKKEETRAASQPTGWGCGEKHGSEESELAHGGLGI